MSLKVKDLLMLPCMREAELIAGASAKENIVNSISVLESTDPALLHNEYFHHEKFRTDEILITGFINTIHDIKSQCECIAGLYEAGASGLIIFYVGVFLPRIDQSLIDLADKLGFPLICMPKGRVILYGEVIADVFGAIFQEKKQEDYLVGEVLERISKISKHQKTVDYLLYVICNQIHCSIALLDRKNEVIHSSTWPNSNAGLLANGSIFKMMQETGEFNEQVFEMESGQQIQYSLFKIPIKHSAIKKLAIISEYGPIGRELIGQLCEIIKLFFSLWGEQHPPQGMSELVQAIIKDEPIKVRKLAEIFKTSVTDLQIMLLFSVEEEIETNKSVGYISFAQKIIEHCGLRSICGMVDNKVVAFIKKPAYPVELSHLAQSLIKKMKDQNQEIALAMQPKLSNMSQAREMFLLFTQHINSAKKIYPRRLFLTFHELVFAKTCQNIIEQGEDAIMRHTDALFSLSPENKQWQHDLINTLSVFLLDAECNILQTSEMIHLHKSTVKYRIKSINEDFGYNIQKMPESYSLYLSVAINRLLH